MWIHLLPLRLIDGAGGGAPVVTQETRGGVATWLLETKSGLDKEGLQKTRKRLGLEDAPKDVVEAVVEVAQEVVAKSGVPTYNDFQRQQLEYERLLRERITSIWRDEYVRVLREEMRRRDDEEIIWLLISD